MLKRINDKSHEVKHCPCCGNEKIHKVHGDYGNFVVCPNCGISTSLHPTLDEAVAVWNRRVNNEQS